MIVENQSDAKYETGEHPEMRDAGNSGQVIYLSHGGGPLPILGDKSHAKMVQFMNRISSELHKPDAIVVISAHWEEAVVTIQSGQQPDILYDYYGFPAAAYQIRYPCPGGPDLAGTVVGLFADNRIESRLDEQRPYDHGSYIPLKMMYPDADIPVIQISLDHSLDPEMHLRIGKALRPLLQANVLIIGSGFSFHNLRRFDFAGKEIEDPQNDAFQDMLITLCCQETDEMKRWRQLAKWSDLPSARYCHPREEHLLPLHVCQGASTSTAQKVFDDYILGKRAVAFLWQ